MIEIIPAILVHSEEEFREKIAYIGAAPKTIQIDVMDGIFVKNTTWADPKGISTMQLRYRMEVHLMVADPTEEVQRWFGIAQRVLVHVESEGWQEAVLRIRDAGREAGAVLNPETPPSALGDMIEKIDTVQIMGVAPGWSGQSFQSVATEKVAELHRKHPWLIIEVDGGVDKETIPPLVAAGATRLIIGSALFAKPDFAAAYRELELLT